MRFHLAGILLILSIGTASFAQVTGYVKELGFQKNFRPDCWTPLLVHLDSTLDKADDYQIQVHQQDLDRDLVVYTKTVTLGPSARQDYWVYFLPEPVGASGGSLPQNPTELARVLKVYVYDKAGSKQLATLPVAFPVTNVDPKIAPGPLLKGRGARLVLVVGEQRKAAWLEYGGAVGVIEDVYFVPVRTSDLPDSVLGYESVDAVLWLDASAQDLNIGGGLAMEALKQYVRKGGVLAICQPRDNFDRLAPFADMLPVVAREPNGEWAIRTASRPDIATLVELARGTRGDVWKDQWPVIQSAKPEWDYAKARPRLDAMVEKWMEWPPAPGESSPSRTPYLARRSYELGAVAWVAQDLGNPALHSANAPLAPGFKPGDQVLSTGWPRVWDRVFGWANDSRSALEQKNETSEREKNLYRGEGPAENGAGRLVDVGRSLLRGMEHAGRGVLLITLAIFFFIGYWIVAGPGGYLYLAAKGRKGWSWMAFGATALAATLLTVGVVKLVLRGSPEIKHFSVVRMTPAEPAPDGSPRFSANVRSRIGLYIPRDGEQRVTLTDTVPGRVSSVMPLAIHPQFVDAKSAGFPNQARYVINVDQFTAGKPVTADFPFRSTLKKLEANWAGNTAEGITGTAQIRTPGLFKPDPSDPLNPRKRIRIEELNGLLTNKTGRELRNIYLAYQSLIDAPTQLKNSTQIIYIPAWRKDQQLDLEAELAGSIRLSRDAGDVPSVSASTRKVLRGLLGEWAEYWYSVTSAGGLESFEIDDSDQEFRSSIPLMSFYDRIGPDFNEKLGSNVRERKEVLRRGGRDLNVSPAVASGKLVIVAQALEGPLPLPLEVEGDKVGGEGTTIYQVVLPLDRSALIVPPATQPATRPAG